VKTLPLHVLEEIRRYSMDYAWEWRMICKIINLKHGYEFEVEEMEKLYKHNLDCIFERPKSRSKNFYY